MKIKKLIIITLVFCLLSSAACAESIFDGIGKWAEQAWNDVSSWTEQALDDASQWTQQAWNDASQWVEQAWKDAPDWIENAWGDASTWVEQVWKDSSKWVVSIWGGVADWANDYYNTLSEKTGMWWIDTFNKVTKETDKAWNWIEEETQATKDTIAKAVSEAENSLDETYVELLEKLNLGKEDIAKVLETLEAYAKEKGISLISLKVVLLPSLTKLVSDRQASGNKPIPAVAVAQYLTGVFEQIKAGTEEEVNQLIDNLKVSLGIN